MGISIIQLKVMYRQTLFMCRCSLSLSFSLHGDWIIQYILGRPFTYQLAMHLGGTKGTGV